MYGNLFCARMGYFISLLLTFFKLLSIFLVFSGILARNRWLPLLHFLSDFSMPKGFLSILMLMVVVWNTCLCRWFHSWMHVLLVGFALQQYISLSSICHFHRASFILLNACWACCGVYIAVVYDLLVLFDCGVRKIEFYGPFILCCAQRFLHPSKAF